MKRAFWIIEAVAVVAAVVLAGCPASKQAAESTAPAMTPSAASAAKASAEGQLPKGVKKLAGDQKPDFTAKGVDGKDVKPADYAGKILVIDFWATWCSACCEKLLEYQPMAEKYKDKGVQFLVISRDNDPATARGWAKEKNVTIPMAMFNDQIQSVFFPGQEAITIPQARILDATGAWRYSMTSDAHVSDVEDAINALLAEKK
jgi:peroxiredoxin